MRPLLYLALALLIYLDALLTYVGVSLGGVEVMLRFVNAEPASMWLVAALKNLAVLYLLLRRGRYPWLDAAAAALAAWHGAAVAWGAWQLAGAAAGI